MNTRTTAQSGGQGQRKSRTRKRQAILVLGMHRSGTSALSGALIQLGATGPRTPMQANEFNERGYWESHKLAIVNDRVLAAAGSRWNDWLQFNQQWLELDEAVGFECLLEETICEEYGDASLFLVKDPRVSRFLPLWLRVLKGMQVSPKAVISVRNPDEVCQSLARRDRFGRAEGQLLWLRYVLEAELGTRGLPRVFVRYDDLLSDWRRQARRIGAALEIRWPDWSMQTEVAIDGFLSEGLRHHGEETRRDADSNQLDRWTSAVYDVLFAFSQGSDLKPGGLEVLDEVRLELDRTSAIYGPAFLERAASASKEIAQLKGSLEGRLKEEQKGSAQLVERLAQMESRALRAEEEAKSQATRALVLGEEGERQQQRLVEQAERHARQEAALETRLEAEQSRADRLEATLRRMEEAAARAADQAREFASTKAELASAKAEHASAAARWADERRGLHGSLDNRFRELAVLARELESQRAELTKERKRGADLSAQANQTARTLKGVQAERDTLAAKQKQLQAEHDRLVGQLTLTASALQAVRGDLDRVLGSNTWKLGRVFRAMRRLVSGKPVRAVDASGDDAEMIRTSGLFDESWYVARYTDVAISGVDPARHYLLYGCQEGRDPSADFSTAKYYEGHPEAAGENALLHFLRNGN